MCLEHIAYIIWGSVDSSWDGGVVHTILGHFDLDIDFWPHF